ncbi:hypothetical protein BME24068_02904 [Burkholderia metallica]|nr:hypothetical protein BME24068_02904 [Burkholderia metallica]
MCAKRNMKSADGYVARGVRAVRCSSLASGRPCSDFHSGPKSASSRPSFNLDRSPDRPVAGWLRVDTLRHRFDRARRRAQAGAGRPHAWRADRLCRASLRQSEPVCKNAYVPVSAAQRYALSAIVRSSVTALASTDLAVQGSVPARTIIRSVAMAKKEARHSTCPGLTRDVPCGSDPLAWSGTGAARHVSDRSDAKLREPDRNMKTSSCGAYLPAALRTGGAARD